MPEKITFSEIKVQSYAFVLTVILKHPVCAHYPPVAFMSTHTYWRLFTHHLLFNYSFYSVWISCNCIICSSIVWRWSSHRDRESPSAWGFSCSICGSVDHQTVSPKVLSWQRWLLSWWWCWCSTIWWSRVSLPVLWTTNCEDLKMTMTTVIVNMMTIIIMILKLSGGPPAPAGAVDHKTLNISCWQWWLL